jgi:hypothetical protein
MDAKIELYNRLVASLPNAERKGATIPYTSLNGHMYSYFSKDGFVALRLPAQEREKFIEKYNTTLVTAYGIVQKEYVVVPDSLLKKTAELKPYFKMSYEYVRAMKPKAASAKKKG